MKSYISGICCSLFLSRGIWGSWHLLAYVNMFCSLTDICNQYRRSWAYLNHEFLSVYKVILSFRFATWIDDVTFTPSSWKFTTQQKPYENILTACTESTWFNGNIAWSARTSHDTHGKLHDHRLKLHDNSSYIQFFYLHHRIQTWQPTNKFLNM